MIGHKYWMNGTPKIFRAYILQPKYTVFKDHRAAIRWNAKAEYARLVSIAR